MSRSVKASIVSLLLLGGSLTAVSTALHQHVKADGGLTQIVFLPPDFSGEVVQRTTTAVVDLSLLVRDDTLPRRLFSIRWSGIWSDSRGRHLRVLSRRRRPSALDDRRRRDGRTQSDARYEYGIGH